MNPEDNGEPQIMWQFEDHENTAELWGQDTDGDYRLTIRGQQTIWVTADGIERLAWAILKDRLRR